MASSSSAKAGATVIDVLKDAGIIKKITKAGSGEAAVIGCGLEVDYTGKLLDGSTFDSSQGYPIKFILGLGNVIRGWDEGFIGSQKGEVCELTIEGKYAYGQEGSPPDIGPNETLIFECTVRNVHAPDSKLAQSSMSASQRAQLAKRQKEEEMKKKEEEKAAKLKAKEEAALARAQKKLGGM